MDDEYRELLIKVITWLMQAKLSRTAHDEFMEYVEKYNDLEARRCGFMPAEDRGEERGENK